MSEKDGLIAIVPDETSSAPRSGEHPLVDAFGRSTKVKKLPQGSVKDVVNRIRLCKGEQDSSAVMLTSSLAGEGVTTISMNVAAALACEEPSSKVLLIDNSGSGFCKYKSSSDTGQTLTREVLSAGDDLDEYFLPSEMGNLRLIRIENAGDGTGLDMDAKDAVNLFELFKEHFSYIIMDGPALSKSSGSLIWCRAVDGIVITVRTGKTRWQVIRRTKDLLVSGSGDDEDKILGVILNMRKNVIPGWIYKRI